MAQDGRDRKLTFSKDKIECFKVFKTFDALPEAIRELKYADFIKDNGAGPSCQAFHEYEIWKKQTKGG